MARFGFMLKRFASRSFLPVNKIFTWNTSHSYKMLEAVEPKEFKIPIPSGHIAGKVWNEASTSTPILGLHGFMDNAGTWDGLAPLLSKNISLVAIDFPAHGLSSIYPRGAMTHMIGLVLVIERIVQHFGWKEVNLLGHSMGAGAAMLYAGTFPEKVKKVFMMDLIKPISTLTSYQPERTAKGIKELIEAENRLNTSPPSYEYDFIVNKLVKSYGHSITENSAKILLKRGSVKNPDGSYSFNFDPRLKTTSIIGMTFEQHKEFAERLQCELMVAKATTGPMYEQQEMYEEILKIYEKKAKKFVYQKIEGTHHVHLNNPELVAPLVCQFFSDNPNHL